jgi:MoaA/NifB/PqqE/SkfB family radical SAM enzyme
LIAAFVIANIPSIDCDVTSFNWLWHDLRVWQFFMLHRLVFALCSVVTRCGLCCVMLRYGERHQKRRCQYKLMVVLVSHSALG